MSLTLSLEGTDSPRAAQGGFQPAPPWCLTQTLMRVRQEGLTQKKMLGNDVRSQNVYENKENSDKLAE